MLNLIQLENKLQQGWTIIIFRARVKIFHSDLGLENFDKNVQFST